MANVDHLQDSRKPQGDYLPSPFSRLAIDRFTDNVIKFLDNMPSRTLCESAIAAGLNGFHIPPCQCTQAVCDIDSELEFCWECWRRWMRGEWDAR